MDDMGGGGGGGGGEGKDTGQEPKGEGNCEMKRGDKREGKNVW